MFNLSININFKIITQQSIYTLDNIIIINFEKNDKYSTIFFLKCIVNLYYYSLLFIRPTIIPL